MEFICIREKEKERERVSVNPTEKFESALQTRDTSYSVSFSLFPEEKKKKKKSSGNARTSF